LAALHHHERINGSGYPHQLKEKDIPYFVQIVSVADCFNAVYMNTQHNGEKKPHFAGVYDLIEKAQRNELNPSIVIPFVRYIMRQNLLQKVMLSNGEEAQIVFIHENEPYQPLVKVGEEYMDLRRESGVRMVSLIEDKAEKIVSYN
jgi:HD-GYP domain-containing protein (c-di-GMP phosphodiesterase class II)